ncbi:MAG: sigma-70 family RNA polymerase sigma factor [Lachnospiraceae bacterium]|nr:sigma-70 family RNA polymerase sigma factor [Lachnospiraceae bacterium]
MAQRLTFEEVYEQNFRYVYNVVYMRVLHRETAEDLTGEVFVKAWQHYDSYDPDIASAVTWLCAIANNEVKSYFRKASTSREIASDELPEVEQEDEADKQASTWAVNREAERILATLDEDERELFSMRLAADLSFKEIGEVLGISEKAATERYRRLLKKCRKLTEREKLEDFL